MRVQKMHYYFVGASTLFALILSFFWVRNLPEHRDSALAFISIGLDQETLTGEVSSYEILRANEHFSDIVLGWTVDPSFAAALASIWDFDHSFSGRRQEKQNLIFEISNTDTIVPAQELVDLIRARLEEYNSITHSAYLVALDHYTILKGERSDSRLILGSTLMVFILSSLGIIFLDYASRR